MSWDSNLESRKRGLGIENTIGSRRVEAGETGEKRVKVSLLERGETVTESLAPSRPGLNRPLTVCATIVPVPTKPTLTAGV
jgi:hypothetical protein